MSNHNKCMDKVIKRRNYNNSSSSWLPLLLFYNAVVQSFNNVQV